MIRSMTGFGRGRAADGDLAISAEVRSVNGKQREIRFRMPSELYPLEAQLREIVQQAIARGRVDVTLGWDRSSGAGGPSAGFALSGPGLAAMREAWRSLNAQLGTQADPPPDVMIRLPGVIEAVPPPEIDEKQALEIAGRALAEALAEHAAVREREGAKLASDLRRRAASVREWVAEIAKQAASQPQRIEAAIRQRLEPLLGELGIDETRLAQEAALAASRADVTEELVRLDAHLGRLSELFAEGGEEIGRRIEFLVQEIRREVTTIGAKSTMTEVDARVLDIKSALEKLREQAANLE